MAKIAFATAQVFIFLTALPCIGINLLQAQEIEESQCADEPQTESTKITLGVVEDVILNPWGVSFPARIDTGADLSSLDARDIVVHDNVADFRLGKRWGSRRIQLPIIDWRHIQTAMGVEKRPVVNISICLGSKSFQTLVTLKDRSRMTYPFLVGRSALRDFFVVDSSRSRVVQPHCSQVSLAEN